MSTGFKTECPHCGKTLRVALEQAGKRARCPSCQQAFSMIEIGVSSGTSIAPSQMAAVTQGMDATAVSLPLSIGKQIGRFELRAELGRGGFGQVFRASDPVLERDVALKLPRFMGADESQHRRFVIEAKAAARLKHPHIVGVYECGEADGQPYIVSEFVSGETLASRLKREQPSLSQAVIWTRDLADALAYAHREGIVHRDIKPGNIMIDGDDRARIMDFGLAKRLGDDQSYAAGTVEGNVLGTPAYMSPEQARAESAGVGPASDQFSLGCVFYELLTGRTPFQGLAHAVVAQVAALAAPPPTQFRKVIPLDLEAICLTALQRDPVRRYAGCDALSRDLDNWLTGSRVSAVASGPWRRLWRRRPHISGITLLMALISCLALSLCIAAAALVLEFLSHRALLPPEASSRVSPVAGPGVLNYQAAIVMLLGFAGLVVLSFLDPVWELRSEGRRGVRLMSIVAVWSAMSAMFSLILAPVLEVDWRLAFVGTAVGGLLGVPLRLGSIPRRQIARRSARWIAIAVIGVVILLVVKRPAWFVGYSCLALTIPLYIYLSRTAQLTTWTAFYSVAGCLMGGLIGCWAYIQPDYGPDRTYQDLMERLAMSSSAGLLAGAVVSAFVARFGKRLSPLR